MPSSERAQLFGPAYKRIAFGRKVLPDFADGTPGVLYADHAVGLVGIRRRGKRRRVTHSQFHDLDGFLDPFESVVAVPLDRHTYGNRVGQRIPRSATHERLPATGQGHDTSREGLGEALDLNGLCAAGDVNGRVLAKSDSADVDANPSA